MLKQKLHKALALAGTHSESDIVRLIEEGRAQLWMSDTAIVVTEVHDYPLCSILHFWIAAGEKNEAIRLANEAIAWGKTQGCTKATLAGRKGWFKVLADEGWQASKLTLMERVI